MSPTVTILDVDFVQPRYECYADGCRDSSAGLRYATKLEVLHVGDCEAVTNVSPFANVLLELNASWDAG